MNIRLVAFATASEILGLQRSCELPDGSRLSDLKKQLEADHPRLVGLWPRLALAIDHTLVARDADPELQDGVEVALLPPVSGGSNGATEMPKVGLVDIPLDAGAIERHVAGPTRGAVLVFLGAVRVSTRREGGGRDVLRLDYSAHRDMAKAALERIAAELEAAGDDLRVALVHRLGEVAVGEASVVIAVASPHREAAYAASREALERLKREVPVWKKEIYTDGGEAWREEEPLGAAS